MTHLSCEVRPDQSVTDLDSVMNLIFLSILQFITILTFQAGGMTGVGMKISIFLCRHLTMWRGEMRTNYQTHRHSMDWSVAVLDISIYFMRARD